MIDIIGTIYTPGTYDSEGEVITPPEPLPGYHVNVTTLIPVFEPFTIETPSHPARLFGDIEHTVFLKFTNREQWLALGVESIDDEGHRMFDTIALEAKGALLKWRETADCTRLQGELALIQLGLFEDVEALVNANDTPQTIKSTYKRAYRWSRRSDMWGVMAPLLNKTEEDIDEFFLLAQSFKG